MSEANKDAASETVQLRFRFREAAHAADFARRMEEGSYNRTTILTGDHTYVALGVKRALASEVTKIAETCKGRLQKIFTPKPLY